MRTLELATMDNLKELVEITDQAKLRMKALGINQWQNGVPNQDTWTASLLKEEVYVLKDCNQSIMGAFCFALGEDPSYDEIDGAWLTADDANYIAVHRFCVSGNHLRKGVALDLLEKIKAKSIVHGLDSVRIDTHEDNLPMQSVINKAGFTKCGIITIKEGIEIGAPRIAYELVLEKN